MSFRLTLAMELIKSRLSSRTRPRSFSFSKALEALNRVMCSMSYRRFSSRASFITVRGERRVGISGRIRAS